MKYKPAAQIPGLSAFIILHENPYIAEFPSVEFNLTGKRHRMPSQQMRLSGFLGKAWIVRWETDDAKVVAYTYSFIPVSAHRSGDKWRVDSEAGCVFDTTFIDDRGDGVFRIMVDGDMRPALIPAWAKEPKS